jgi:phosphoadenosine phosphosulfate reductase
MNLQEKIDYSIKLIRKYEKIALGYSPEGYHVAFSGGKDSQAILELTKMAGVKYRAFFYKTSIDPPELTSFIRSDYPEVIWLKPRKTMFQMILEKKGFPTMRARWCCAELKERQGLNEVVIIGIRAAESTKRAKRKEFESECKLGKDKVMLSPIFEWQTNDVYDFLKLREIKLCSVYQFQTRVGCLGCPLNRKAEKELERYPKVKKAYINTAQKVIDRNPDCNYAKLFKSGADAYKWWLTKKSVKEYIAERDLQYKLDFTPENML